MKKLLLCLLCLCLFACSPSDNSNNQDADNNNSNNIQDVVDNNDDLSEHPYCYEFVQNFLKFFNTNYPEYEVKLIENTYSVIKQEAQHDEEKDRLFISIKAINKYGNELYITFLDWGIEQNYFFDGITLTHDSLLTNEDKEYIIAICQALGFDASNKESVDKVKSELNKFSNGEYDGEDMGYLTAEAEGCSFMGNRIKGNDGNYRYSIYIMYFNE